MGHIISIGREFNMNLKESFRYQNYLSDLWENANVALSDSRNITKIKQEHLRKKANPDAEDEIVDLTKERDIPCTADELVKFLLYIAEERDKITDAISTAKRTSEFDFDAETAKNKKRQDTAKFFAKMARVKPTETTRCGTAYKFNVEGVQAPYYYDIIESTEVDFDIDAVKTAAREMNDFADKISTCLDELIVSLQVDYTPMFSINDSFEEAVAIFLKNN